MITATEITDAVARWIDEASHFQPAKARRVLREKARWIAQQITAEAGPAWSLITARQNLLAAAQQYESPAQ